MPSEGCVGGGGVDGGGCDRLSRKKSRWPTSKDTTINWRGTQAQTSPSV